MMEHLIQDSDGPILTNLKTMDIMTDLEMGREFDKMVATKIRSGHLDEADRYGTDKDTSLHDCNRNHENQGRDQINENVHIRV